MHECNAYGLEHSLVRHYNFTAVRVATPTHVFIGKLAGRWPALPTLDWIEVYRIGADGYTETFVGYAEGEHRARLIPPMVRAAECVLASESVRWWNDPANREAARLFFEDALRCVGWEESRTT